MAVRLSDEVWRKQIVEGLELEQTMRPGGRGSGQWRSAMMKRIAKWRLKSACGCMGLLLACLAVEAFAASTEPSATSPFETLPGDHTSGVAFSADGRFLVAGSRRGVATVYSMPGFTLPVPLAGGDWTEWAGWANQGISDDGELIVTGTLRRGANQRELQLSRDARVWERRTGRVIRVFEDRIEGAARVAISGNGKVVATSSDEGTVRAWDVQSGRELLKTAGEDGSPPIALGPTGEVLAIGDLQELEVWRTANSERMFSKKFETDVLSICITQDKLLWSGRDGRIRSMPLVGGAESVIMGETWGMPIHRFAVSPDGRYIAAAGHLNRASKLRVGDLSKGTWLAEEELDGYVYQISFSADAQLLAVSRTENAVVWEWRRSVNE